MTIIVPKWLVRTIVGAIVIGAIFVGTNTYFALRANSNADGAIRTNRISQQADNQALCSLRADVQKRVDSGRAFLTKHPYGIPGISAPTLQTTVNNSQRTVDALSALVCP